LAVLFWKVFDKCASQTVHDSVQCVVLVAIAVQLVPHDDRPVRFKSIGSRFQIALPLKETIRHVLISDTKVVQHCLLLWPSLLYDVKC